MNIYTVATAPNYNYKQANRFLDQLGHFYNDKFKLFCYTDNRYGFSTEIEVVDIPARKHKIERQWNKIDFFNPNATVQDEPIIVSDLDWTFLSDVTDIINTPLLPNEFMGIRRWWYAPETNYTVNGGMYKFYAGELQHVYDTFYEDPLYWQQYYIRIGKVRPPVNGEQNFVKDHVDRTHTVKYFEPFDAIGRYPVDDLHLREYNMCYMARTNQKDFFFLDGEFNEKIRMVHSIIN